jgi:peptidoglycan/xylan/chitin deacetylase (PgdA/CDA1 family)
MKMHIPFGFLLSTLPLVVAAQNIAFSFDDGFDPRSQVNAAQWNAALLEGLAQSDVKAIFFASGSRVDSPQGLSLVADWGDSGHDVSNHTYSHFSLGSNLLEDFIADVEKNEALLVNMPGWVKRFRFPYLKEGRTAEKRDGFRQWMADHGYQSGAVSIDASDWYYSNRYEAWLVNHHTEDPVAFRTAYLNHLWDRASYYDGLSQSIFNRSINHVLLLHTNAINAAFITDVVAMFRAKGWNIIDPDEAYSDAVYATVPDSLPAGESILWSFAKQNEVPDLRYPAEDAQYEKPVLDSLGL